MFYWLRIEGHVITRRWVQSGTIAESLNLVSMGEIRAVFKSRSGADNGAHAFANTVWKWPNRATFCADSCPKAQLIDNLCGRFDGSKKKKKIHSMKDDSIYGLHENFYNGIMQIWSLSEDQLQFQRPQISQMH